MPTKEGFNKLKALSEIDKNGSHTTIIY
jgi:hypothetical protein